MICARVRWIASAVRRTPPCGKEKDEEKVSKYSGDKARAHRIRKQNIARRLKIRILREQLAAAKTSATTKS
jgi:hypothetical protein